MAGTAENASEEKSNEDEATPSGGRKKILILAGGGAGLLLAIAGAAVLFLSGPSGPPSGDGMAEAPVAAPAPAFFFDLPEMLVNLNSENRTQYLRTQIALEIPEEEMMASIEENLPRVLDSFQIYLRELRPRDLEGSAGLFHLKEELRRRINISVSPARVNDVLFKQLLVQ